MPEVVFRRILVPTDFSPPSERAWELARRLARAVGAEIVLLHVSVPPPPPFVDVAVPPPAVIDIYAETRKWVEDQLARWAATATGEGLTVKTVLRDGSAHREIIATAKDEGADLITIGTHGYSGVERLLLGSVAEKVIRSPPVPCWPSAPRSNGAPGRRRSTACYTHGAAEVTADTAVARAPPWPGRRASPC